MQFRLFDGLSRQVMNLSLLNTETEVNRNSLPSGIYFWQVIKDGKEVKAGKLVIE